MINPVNNKQEMSLKKPNGVGLKKGKIKQEDVLVHKSYTDDRKLTTIMFKYQ